MVPALVLGWTFAIVASAPDAEKAPDLAAYQQAKAAAGRDADAHVALALWCEAHGMPAEKSKHLARAVLLDPSNVKARGLSGYVQHDGKWMRPEEVSRSVEESVEAQALFREYQDRRIKARDKADDQYKLAQWCEEHKLDQQATAHYHRVVELDPGRDLAWKHLGFKKTNGRWVKPEVEAARKAENEAQAKADKFWKPKLEHAKQVLSGRDKEVKAESTKFLAAIEDPRAVPMVWEVFARGGERWQQTAARVFGRIAGAGASRALAMTAVFSPFANVRSEASQSLLDRDPREFARLLANLIQDEIKYKKTNVAGPGAQGELLVEGKDANVKRLYTPLQRPELAPGDRLDFDESGMVVADRPMIRAVGPVVVGAVSFSRFDPRYCSPGGVEQFIFTGMNTPWPVDPALARRSAGAGSQAASEAMARILHASGASSALSQRVSAAVGHSTSRAPAAPTGLSGLGPFAGQTSPGGTLRPIFEQDLRFAYERMNADAENSAIVAQQRLNADVQRIDEHNAPIREVNQRVSTILKSLSGRDLGVDRDRWMEWVYDVEGFGFPLKVAASRPTFVENVPLDYQPQAPLPTVASGTVGFRIGPSCFAGGTLVRTLRGAQPIEEVRVGDQALTQDTTTGKLDYRPVVAVFHNPPNWTYRIDLGSETVFPTGIHRFWKAGQGWIMARDVKAGDRLRTLGGTVEVVSASKDKIQPVFNLLLDGGDDYYVGGQGVLAHDNGFVDPVERPFDGVPALAGLATADKP